MKKENKLIVFTRNDVWRVIGILLLIAGYFFDKEMSVQWGDKSFTGGMFGIVGLALVLAPIFLRSRQ